METDERLVPVCRICGRPIEDGSEMVSQEAEDADEPRFVYHRACRDSADAPASG